MTRPETYAQEGRVNGAGVANEASHPTRADVQVTAVPADRDQREGMLPCAGVSVDERGNAVATRTPAVRTLLWKVQD